MFIWYKADFNLSPIATWVASATFEGNYNTNASYWPNTLIITGLAASMAVNTLMTGMIVFRILKVTAGAKPTSVERALGSTRSKKFWHIMFVIIESGMALFAIQLVRVVLVSISPVLQEPSNYFQATYDIVVVINQMLNVIVKIRSFTFLCYFCWYYLIG